MKKIHFYDTLVELRWSNRPNGIPGDQFKNLLDHWNNPKVEQQQDPDKKEPTQHMVYKASRVRNPNKAYKTDELIAKENIESMDALHSLATEKNSSYPYYEVVDKPENHGRVRLYGKIVGKLSVNKKGNTGFILPQEYMQNLQAQ